MDLEEDLVQLCKSGILERQSRTAGQVVYTFRHALLRETAYQSQLKARRRESHRNVAHVLEARYPNVVTTEPEVLAPWDPMGALAAR